MAASIPLDPVLHVEKNDPVGVFGLGKRMKSGLFYYPLIFVDPTPDEATFTTANELLGTYIGQAKGNHSIIVLRDDQCLLVHGYLSQLLHFAKPICNHNASLIEKSGFDSNYQPSKLPPPEAPVIKSITKGKEAGTYKIFLTRKQNKKLVDKAPKSHLKGVKYYAELTATIDDAASWVRVCDGVASTKLIFSEVVPGKKNWVRVWGKNANGKGHESDPAGFTPDAE